MNVDAAIKNGAAFACADAVKALFAERVRGAVLNGDLLIEVAA